MGSRGAPLERVSSAFLAGVDPEYRRWTGGDAVAVDGSSSADGTHGRVRSAVENPSRRV
ncbi:hypothetical protein [Halopiger thermotolerans]